MKISYSQIETYCNEMHTLAKKMKETIENIETISYKIRSADSWDGDAADHYAKKLRSVTREFDEAFEGIEKTILFMILSSEEYKKIDQHIMREICSNLKINNPSPEMLSTFNGG